MSADGSYENAYNWQYGGVVAPYYGAFAECVDTSGMVCALVCDITGAGFQVVTHLDAYVWGDQGGSPGNVLSVATGTGVTPPAYPDFQRYTVPFPSPPCVDGRSWVGLWYAEPGTAAVWYIGADLDGPGGCPMTNIAPGIGYPTGWQSVSVAFGPTRAMGLGAGVVECPPVGAKICSWGLVKGLYR